MFDVYSVAQQVRVGEIEIVVTDHGSRNGTPVLLIHGFPDSARLWRHQIPALTHAGYRAIAPDLRGFGRSDRPADVDEYKMSTVARDMIAVLDDADLDEVHVVGHDWGAAIAWYLALTSPDRVRTLVALSVGHPSAFREAGIQQVEKSWYMLLFQFQGVAESWLSDNDWRGLREWTGSPPEIDHWINDLSRPGATTAALNLYRANMGPERLIAPARNLPPLDIPAMGIWSTDDIALLEEQMTESKRFVTGEWRYERIENATHWIPVDTPDRLNRLLLEWLGEH